MKDADSILKKALGLPLDERERLALKLMESLGAEGAPGIVSEDELADTINERLADIDVGRAKLLDTKKALAKGRAKLRRRRRA
ncbi:MAG: addiction module protein [Planctomycetota bacterium]